MISRHPVNGGKITSDDDIAICLNNHGIDAAIYIRVKVCIKAAIIVEPGGIISRHPVNGCKIAPDDDFFICLNDNGRDAAISIWEKGRIIGKKKTVFCFMEFSSGSPQFYHVGGTPPEGVLFTQRAWAGVQ